MFWRRLKENKAEGKIDFIPDLTLIKKEVILNVIFLKMIISLEFLAINTLCFIIFDKYKGKKNKLLKCMPYIFPIVGAIILSTFVFFTG